MSVSKRLPLLAALVGVFAVSACGDDPIVEPTVVNPPANVTAAAAGETSIMVSWDAVSNASTYRVERQVVGGTFGEVWTGAETQYTDTGLSAGTVYNYRVIAIVSDGTESAASEPVSTATEGARREELSGNFSADRTLDADTVYILKGVVQVQDGATLTIEPGTVVQGDKATQGTLIVLQGGKIMADGTAAAPIVFTSAQPEGQREKGDWGGLIINGRSNCNFPAGQCLGEGNTGVYGGSDPDDNSGVLRYVRIEWAGIEFSPDNELNGLTLNGVGAGTTIEFVQSHGGRDDGIEFFGGTVDLKHAVVTLASDDSFDWSTGWQGRGQFWIVQQDPDDGDNGWEVDNNEGDFEALPRTFGQIYNFTLVGRSGAGDGSDLGILFRRGYAGAHSCGIVMGFGDPGLDIDDAATERLAGARVDSLTLTHTIFFENGRNDAAFASPGVNYSGDTESDGSTTDFEAQFGARMTGIQETNPMLADPYNLGDPDFSPNAGSPALAAGCSPPSDGWFTAATYLGAVADGSDTWYKGWTTGAAN